MVMLIVIALCWDLRTYKQRTQLSDIDINN